MKFHHCLLLVLSVSSTSVNGNAPEAHANNASDTSYGLMRGSARVLQSCGGGVRGNGVCSDGTCCSRFGWCGTSSEHCEGSCGNGSRGDGVCASGECCSEWGWCGTSSAHCNPPPVPPPTPVAGPPPGQNGGTCGNGSRGDGICPSGECCSEWGWCGTSSAHCNNPQPNPPPVPPPTQAPGPNPQPNPTPTPPGSSAQEVVEVLESSKSRIDNELFLYKTPENSWQPSTVYRYDGFIAALRVMYEDGVNNKFFYVGDGSSNGHEYGLANIAAFLAQSKKETIQYDACDENSWDLVNGRYPLSNACGQLGQSYQDYSCSAEEANMECPVDPNMQITAVTNAKWYGAPAPLKCGPKSVYPFTGYWDYSAECNQPWLNPPQTCDAYEGQRAGKENNDAPSASTSGRTDVEGCCWWGRGVIQTTGPCNFGKLNYFLGKRAAEEGRSSRYPTVDFCRDPEAICASQEFTELKWIAGMFYWIESVQGYEEGGWNYLTELHKFVDGGMTDTNFINSVSGIVNRGCHNPPCAAGPVDGGPERTANFREALEVFGL